MNINAGGQDLPRDLPLHGEDGLLAFADAALPGLRLPNGIFCFDRPWSEPTLRGESVRYSMMVLLGVLRRAATGASVSVDPHDLHRLIHARRSQLGIGDLGLLLWADLRIADESAAMSTLADLERASAAPSALAPLEGMEAAWFAIGAIAAHAGGLGAVGLVARSMDELRRRQSADTGLFRHVGTSRLRARLPNFATQIYSLLALAEAARHDVAGDARGRAERLAGLLIDSRDAHNGWPWLYNSERGGVVERYEVYSVHQDAMAPMALLALAEVTGERAYVQAALEGLRWGFGNNELGVWFYDAGNGFAHRSLRRKGLARHAGLYGNTGLSLAGRALRVDPGRLEVNATCRPYHLGWILEAWSGREALIAEAGPS
ncbi:MAG: hypothetical protein AB7I38_19245 [Dehalococcoidia bacterium]